MEMQMCVSASKDQNESYFPLGQEKKRANDNAVADNVVICHESFKLHSEWIRTVV